MNCVLRGPNQLSANGMPLGGPRVRVRDTPAALKYAPEVALGARAPPRNAGWVRRRQARLSQAHRTLGSSGSREVAQQEAVMSASQYRGQLERKREAAHRG